MPHQRSIRFRLTMVFMFFLILVVVLGLFSIGRLRELNDVSADIRDRWLQNTRYLGDLNNYTSDFRAAEATHLLSAGSIQIDASEKEIKSLDRSVLEARKGYEHVYHNERETLLYGQFAGDWDRYRRTADQVLALSRANRKTEAIGLYMTASRAAYDAASDTLGLLTDRNAADAREASDRADTTYRAARSLIEGAILAAGLMVAAAVGYIRHSLSSPLRDIAASMHRLAANETNIEIPGTHRKDEIGEMARTVVVFRNNAIDLALSRQGLAQQASMLAEKLEQEQHLTALQRNFVMMASHEFRTPLGVIDGHAQRMIRMKERLQPEEIAERAGKVRSAVLQLISLIENLLNSSRLFDGDASLYFHPSQIDLEKLLHEVCHMHREITPEARIVENIAALPHINGDLKLLRQLFSNLLANAVKYSPHGGLITITATCGPQCVTITVQDHGLGIPQKDMPRLFERYYRGGNVSGITGTGVGLYLARMVMELHGGEVSVESREGRGSTFTVRMPRMAAHGE